uniref:Uncharacterized protein n=1 Tax=Utricularia reniformis TaxID=192314 RepID=A0A1Y0B305_9LAMI|nr:hypothetical protein AEK19_MT1578 [Utricularia reniformis]ART31763.1 hypothetical protein AEK19_MT1578 [Utricularia reniformis]
MEHPIFQVKSRYSMQLGSQDVDQAIANLLNGKWAN